MRPCFEAFEESQSLCKWRPNSQEIIFVAEPDANAVYKFDLDLTAKAKDFGHTNGDYAVHLIVGDAVIENPIDWHVVGARGRAGLLALGSVR